jgi:hypothetical protein
MVLEIIIKGDWKYSGRSQEDWIAVMTMFKRENKSISRFFGLQVPYQVVDSDQCGYWG